MVGKLIIHVGPPKTASTSLQIALATVSHPEFIYAGAFQPRTRNQDSLCLRLYKACLEQSDNVKPSMGVIRDLSSLVNSGKTVFVSEEMFLVEQDIASIREKLSRLRQQTTDLDCRILITLRRPKHALPSYYQEVFNSLPITLQLNYSSFCEDRRTFCYDYLGVCNFLQKVGFHDIKLIDFDYLSAGRVDLGRLTGCSNFDGIGLSLDRHNTGRSGEAPTERFLPKVSLKNMGRISAVKSLIDFTRMRHWPGYKQLVSALDRVSLRPEKEHSLTIPRSVLEHLDASYDAAKEKFCIVTTCKHEAVK